MDKIPYNDTLPSADQIDMEERIAAIIFDHPEKINEEVASELGRTILYEVLRKFKRDLFVDWTR